MSDLWSEAAAGAEAEQLNREYVAARVAAEDVWDFLAQASSGTDYANRKGLMEARLDAIVAEHAPSHSLKVRERLEAEFDKQAGKRIAANRKEAGPLDRQPIEGRYANRKHASITWYADGKGGWITSLDYTDQGYLIEAYVTEQLEGPSYTGMWRWMVSSLQMLKEGVASTAEEAKKEAEAAIAELQAMGKKRAATGCLRPGAFARKHPKRRTAASLPGWYQDEDDSHLYILEVPGFGIVEVYPKDGWWVFEAYDKSHNSLNVDGMFASAEDAEREAEQWLSDQGVIAKKQATHQEHVKWLMHQYALTEEEAEKEAQERYEKYPQERERWQASRKQAGFVSTPDGRIRREEDGTYECPVCGKPWKGHGFIMGTVPVCSKESRKQAQAAVTVRPKHVGKEKRLEGWDVIVVHSPTLSKVVTTLPSKTEAVHYAEAYAREAGFFWHKANTTKVASDDLLGPVGSILSEISDPKLSGSQLNPYVQQLVEMAGQPDLGEIGSIVSEVSDPKLSGAQLNPYVQQIEQILKGAKKQAGIGPGENVIKVWQGTNKGIPGAFTLTEGGHGAGGEYILYFKRGDGGSDDPSTPGFTDWRIVGRGDDPDALLAKHDDNHLGSKKAAIGPSETVIEVWQGTNKGIPGAFTLTEGGHGAGGQYILYFKRGDGGSDDPSTPGFTDWRIVGRGDDPDALRAKHDDDHLGNIYGQKKASKRYETAKQVVETGQAGEIEGHALDSTSAKALIAGYEALTPENQARFDQVPLDQLMKIIWKNVARKRTATRLNAPEEGWAIIEDVLSAGRVEDVRRGGPSSDTQITIAVPGGNEYHFTHFDSLGWRWASQSIYGKWEGVHGAGCDAQGFKITDEDHVAYLDAVLQGRG